MVRSGKNGGLHLKQISYYKRTGEYHPTTLASERSGIRRAAKKFVFKENKLFYVGKDRKQMRLVIVSDEEKKRVLHKCHESAAGAHHGISRTLTLVESSYYWTSITNDVKQWVCACQHCQVAKNTAIIVPKLHPIKVEDPWTAVAIDLMGPFSTTRRNHMYVIMMTDLFTKWVVVLPLQDTSAVEIAKAIVSVFFSYGPLKKMVIDQAEEFVHQINRELFELFGMKQIVLSYPQTDDTNERTCRTIKTFLSKYCAEHPNDWDDDLSAIAYAFNLTPMEPVQNTPYFQMFNRNPYVSETSNVLQEAREDNKCMFAKILEAIKQADRVLEERKATKCQIEKNRIDEQQTGNKVNIKRKPKQINPFHLKVGHEVLRQRKNWWKDGRFQSEWVGPCIIDYITDNGCAILRETTGSRLKRPIKMSHLKPYIRRSSGQDNHYLLQGSIVVDHDYVGLSESSYGPCPQDTIAEGEVNTPAANNLLSPPCKDNEPSECKSQSEFTEDHSIMSANSNPEQWSSSCWTLQTKLEDT
ncbi:gypsy retrotransposon integrase-like protein 1 isoform X1 [Gopherus evgoodei]|uniref:Gypsy retrotransposon integrase-like protein 1 n=1 Tax=Gopherus evgoodei TaxID=1825980 RepID=A0A8C4VLE8_9SAUR|nr:gypsy retrotransposon integrase-like protein 1 isoform X1 [Gopherus evgoodei]XP_030421748.1 gypsy retrotransposon integrase-like protein 1 isoform X1 [Gopherus evgoodei]XP_030421749.1 gypsy retrotransposon integrase-like protein 1 isoform X1 [Gopherus evgoodei]XP_030421751.1 gypsy retrotransposon integrase-like protein 1 isoform X1 [Gopherus evgoodei]XP_030421753.1 gypsy retrotransposon integrase-like protein 1 isoform X1 [Gopherus evgoodei]